jgi:hypothetical protein
LLESTLGPRVDLQLHIDEQLPFARAHRRKAPLLRSGCL